ncbi:hypothetical protein KDI_08780 [Dictyobacter arantiisoli]|uniref:DZANK-type domain-containing protein n=2 Tax=Dictyobacter arantiisoli TaxID=2014874 RepID=A0A5A5T8S6_9CHLR|nr:hypothetical protein KDI_08780 [Dictyobacter arantiisoli]
MRISVGIQCAQCGKHNAQDMRFCGGCGAQLVAGVPARSGQYPAAPQQSYPQYPVQTPQYQQYQQQQQYGQGGYQQPMLGQQPMVLRCPSCMAMAQVGSANCVSCRTSLAGVVPTPINMPAQGQQSGIGGFLQGNGGKLAIGALGGAAALLGGEMLINGFENNIENRIEGDMGFGGGRRHHHREEDEGMLGGLGKLADDIGLF